MFTGGRSSGANACKPVTGDCEFPATSQLNIPGITVHSLRRTFIAMHVEAKTHPKKIQTRAGHEKFGTTMDIYAKLAGNLPLGDEEHARLNNIASKALPAIAPADTQNDGDGEDPQDKKPRE